MDNLISREALLKEFRSLCGPQTGDGWDNMGVHNLIMRQKAVDAVPVVRCRECRYWRQEVSPTEHWVCAHHSFNERKMYTTPDFYCADGERRDEDATD